MIDWVLVWCYVRTNLLLVECTDGCEFSFRNTKKKFHRLVFFLWTIWNQHTIHISMTFIEQICDLVVNDVRSSFIHSKIWLVQINHIDEYISHIWCECVFLSSLTAMYEAKSTRKAVYKRLVISKWSDQRQCRFAIIKYEHKTSVLITMVAR